MWEGLMRLSALLLLLLTAPALAQTSENNRALAACVQAADQKYKDTWDALCANTGRVAHCREFIGSPKDKEFSQLRIEEMTLCGKLYSR
jgi:hypothetical protein